MHYGHFISTLYADKGGTWACPKYWSKPSTKTWKSWAENFTSAQSTYSIFPQIPLSVTTIASLLGVLRHTIHRRMSENGMSVTSLYSQMTNEELDAIVADIKSTMPDWMMKGALKSRGFLIQWEHVRASMHRVDTVGVLTRLSSMGCIVRRTYSVSCPRSHVHIGTNHKLIR